MDRRDFLTASAAATAGVAMAGAGGLWRAASAPDGAVAAPVADAVKRGGRLLVPEAVTARDLGGALPFVLGRIAEPPSLLTVPRLPVAGHVPVLQPLRDVAFRGFAGSVGDLEKDSLAVVAVHIAADGTTLRHQLWSHEPARLGGTSPSVLFSAHDDAFAGFEVTLRRADSGKRSAAMFAFMASGSGPQLVPGVYVLAGPRAATGLPPDLTDHAYSGDIHRPLRPSRLVGLDFAYLSFVVHGEFS